MLECHGYPHCYCFSSLREFPFVRYHAAKSFDPTTMTTYHDLIPTKLAARIWNCLVKCKSIPNFPQKETRELLILDKTTDQTAPIIESGLIMPCAVIC